jgi:hypothetical protein
MAQDLPEIRPAVISSESATRLEEIRRFRHLARNVCTFNLASANPESFIADLPAEFPKVKAELLSFADFLNDLGKTT